MGDQRVVVVTGASSGIGAVVAASLAEQGDHVVAVGRDIRRTEDVARRIGGEPYVADFARLDEVRELAETLSVNHPTIDVLLSNAGGLVSRRGTTVDGHDLSFQVNQLAPYLLMRLLTPSLRAAATQNGVATVVATASAANRWGRIRLDDLEGRRRPWLGGWRAYGTAKLAVVLTARELARREGDHGIGSFSVHPGAVVTSFGSGSALIRLGTALTGGRWGTTPDAGAAPLFALASGGPVPAPNGTYFDGLRAGGRTAGQADDAALAAELWRRSAEMTGLPAQ
ncbi:SDR family NAD(P)-dependent oxidoreductase [Herbiconiux liangxiaofengii]|uniref:SDR family NAD(P)-dependent oxidoreductase n=1 Tax=Herbiconiux liangxiaofengii TaxID=3342795 RepID=UPI0035B82C8D